jgi:hypothetical protein
MASGRCKLLYFAGLLCYRNEVLGLIFLRGISMTLRAPNIALFVIAGCLAMLGVLAALPISLPIPGLTGNSAWCIFLAWFLLAAGAIVPTRNKDGLKGHPE